MSNKNTHMFTVFTPTFNRETTLFRVYEGLIDQNFPNFEWLIVDDGSTDGTEEKVRSWILERKINIRYFKQENFGKHVAFNRAVANAKGDLFLNIDSDDFMLPNCLSLFKEEWDSIICKHKYAGVCGLGVDISGKVIGDVFPYDRFDSNPSEVTYKYKIKGDKCGFIRTDVLKEFPFPENLQQKFYAEGIIWSRIGKIYKTRYINQRVCTFGYDGGKQLSTASIKSRSGNRIFYAHYLDEELKLFSQYPLAVFKIAIQGVRLSFHNKDKISEQLTWLNSVKSRILWLIAVPLGFILFKLDRVIDSGS